MRAPRVPRVGTKRTETPQLAASELVTQRLSDAAGLGVSGRLYYGDNLDVLRRYVKDESVDLVYLDPPFKSNKDYNLLFTKHDGAKAAGQMLAFKDTWKWDTTAARSFEEVVEQGGDVSTVLQAFRSMLGDTDMLAYLAMMAPRLVELKRVLKPTGSIYLHCDASASSHLRLLMDAIFSPRCFLNEIIWHYQTSSGAPKKWLHRNHDTILRYAARSPELVTWHHPREPWPEKTLKKWQKDEQGRLYRVQNKFNKRYYVDPAGKHGDDVWDITLSSRTRERLGYPTQKPIALLERIVAASSNPGDVVLDPFCGCGTTVDAAQKLGRNWIGVDITHLAIDIIRQRLATQYGQSIQGNYEVIAEPRTLDDAAKLARENPYHFQEWALGLIGIRPSELKKGADKGIDGVLHFHDEPGQTKKVIVSVKAGKLHATDLRDLVGVVQREHAQMGVLISFANPTKPMRVEAASAGFYTSPLGSMHPKLQLLTIRDLIEGNGGIDLPMRALGGLLKHASQSLPRNPVVPFQAPLL